MSTTATYAVTMAELKTDAQHGSLWSNYGSPVQHMSGRFNSIDAAVSNPTTASPHLGRPRSSNPGMDYQPPYHYSRHSQDEGDAYDRQPQHQALQPHHSYPSLKRPYSHTEQAPYTEMVQDLRDDGNKLSMNHDHKLLSFKRTQDKHTIVDQHGRIQQLELSAQLHGMFFLSEMPASSTDGSVLQPELTCYRRNLFQISGSLVTPRSPLSVVTETGETVAVSSTDVTVSAIESVDGHPVRLIVIPWKTPPPNTPEIAQGPDQEPASLPLIPFQDDGEAEGDYAVYPIGWRRLQFRIATANNGRRKELQQHFVLHLKVMGTLANGTKVVLTEATTSPIVVRGRSPRNFQARKEIPLLGSSAGSRGQALVETGMGIVAGPLTAKPAESKPRSVDLSLPRTAFTFNGPKQMPQSPMGMRSNSYPQPWNGSSQMPLSHVPSSGPAYPASSMAADPYHKVPLSGGQNYTAEPQDMPLQTSMPSVQLSLAAQDHQQPPIRTQYATYVQGSSAPPQLSLSTTADSSLSVPRYLDHNSQRPSKSPRHAGHQSVHSTSSSVPSDPTSGDYRYSSTYGGVSSTPTEISPSGAHPPQQGSYGSSGAAPSQPQQQQHESGSAPSSSTTAAPPPPPPRDYFPSAQSWTTTAGEAPSSSVSYTNGDHNRYAYSYQEKSGGHHHAAAPKSDAQSSHQSHQQHGQASQGYGGPGLTHYAWNAS